MVDFEQTISQFGLNSSPEIISLCDKCFTLGRQSVFKVQLEGRLRSPKFRGRGLGCKDKKTTKRNHTKKLKAFLFKSRRFKLISDEAVKENFRNEVNEIEYINKITYKSLKDKLNQIFQEDVLKVIGGINGI